MSSCRSAGSAESLNTAGSFVIVGAGAPGFVYASFGELDESFDQALGEGEDLPALTGYDEEYIGEYSYAAEPISAGLTNPPGAITGRSGWPGILRPPRDIEQLSDRCRD